MGKRSKGDHVSFRGPKQYMGKDSNGNNHPFKESTNRAGSGTVTKVHQSGVTVTRDDNGSKEFVHNNRM